GVLPGETTRYEYDGNQIVLAINEAGNVSNRYLWAPAVDQLLADEHTGGNVLWALTDHLGTVRDLVDSSGVVENHTTYDAFGNVTSETDAAVDELFGYTGRAFEEATGLQNNLNRWYDAAVGRWVNEDPIGFDAGDANLFRYAGNGPIIAIDPDGLNWLVSANQSMQRSSIGRFLSAIGDAGIGTGEFFVGFLDAGGDIGAVTVSATLSGANRIAGNERASNAWRAHAQHLASNSPTVRAIHQFDQQTSAEKLEAIRGSVTGSVSSIYGGVKSFVCNLYYGRYEAAAEQLASQITVDNIAGGGLIKNFIKNLRKGGIPNAPNRPSGFEPHGTNPLPGTRVRPEGIPDGWRIRPTKGKGGVEYYNPKNPNESVRVMQGNPNSPYPNSQGPYVRQRDASGTYLRSDGTPSTLPKGGLKDPDAHVPLQNYPAFLK
ncbi:MAG: hypothetical protein MI725_05690, partial [Pirellulales bacterium]|nr:hypothetical protein [Pirellulales bacterium]